MKKGYLTVLWPQITNILDEYNCVNKIARIVGSGFLTVLGFENAHSIQRLILFSMHLSVRRVPQEWKRGHSLQKSI